MFGILILALMLALMLALVFALTLNNSVSARLWISLIMVALHLIIRGYISGKCSGN